MKVLFAHCFYRIPGGEDRHVRDQVELVSRVHEVELMSEANAELSAGPRTAARMLYSHANRSHVGGIIDRFGADVVHLHNMYPSLGPAVILAAQDRGVPVAMTVHNVRLRCPNGLMFTEGSPCRRCEAGAYHNAVVHRCFPAKRQAMAYATILWTHRFVMRLEHRIACFIVPSEFMRKRLLSWRIPPERIRLIRHFVSPPGEPVERRIGSYGMFMGRLSAEKGLDVLLAALHRAGDPRFLVVGDGPERPALERMAVTLGLSNCRFLGWRPHDEIGEFLADARFVALPSSGEENAPLSALRHSPPAARCWFRIAEVCPIACRPVPGECANRKTRSTRPAGSSSSWRRTSSVAVLPSRLSSIARLVTPERHLANLESVYAGMVQGVPRIQLGKEWARSIWNCRGSFDVPSREIVFAG